MSSFGPTLLIAEDSVIESLRRANVLPKEWLEGQVGSNLLSVASLEEAIGKEDPVERAQWFHKHVQDAEQVIWLNTYKPADSAGVIDKTLEQFEKWHAMLKKELGYLNPQVDESWVVVLTGAPRPEWKETLENIFSRGEKDKRLGPDGPIYLMGDKLNYLKGNICHATHVWPLAVSNLLIGLVAKGQNNVRKSDEVFAWRTFNFLPMKESALSEECETIVAEIQHKLQEESLIEAKKTISGGGMAPVWMTGKITNLDGPAGGEFTDKAWLDYEPRRELKIVNHAQSWADEAKRKNEAENAASDVNDLSGSAGQAVTSYWRGVHDSPGFFKAILSDQSFAAKADFTVKEKEQASLSKKIITLDCRRKDLERDASDCAAALREAQNAFLPIGIRLGLSFAVMSFIVFVVWSLFVDVFENWSLAIVAISATLGGVIAASVLPWRLQKTKGQHSVRKYREAVVDKLKDNHRKVHKERQMLLFTGIDFHNNTVTRMTIIRLRELFERLNTVFYENFASTSKKRSLDGGVVDIRQQDDGGSTEQASAYLEYTSCYLNEEAKQITTEQKNRIKDSQYAELVSKWEKFVQEHDVNSMGHLPIAKLEEFLKERRHRIEMVVAYESIGSGEINDQKITNIIEDRTREKKNEKFQSLLSVVTPTVGNCQASDFSISDTRTSPKAKRVMRTADVIGVRLEEYEISASVLNNWFDSGGE